MKRRQEILHMLSKSQVYRDYESAFCAATSLPLTLRPEQIWQHAMSGKEHGNAFCALLAKSNRSCAACLEVQEMLTTQHVERSRTVTCFAGLYDTAVPVHVGADVVGYLQTGQVALQPLSAEEFSRITHQVIQWGVQVDLTKLEDAYFHSRVLEPQQYAAMVRLLEIFAEHLAATANHISIQVDHAEPDLVTRARAFISSHQNEAIPLEAIARALNVSAFYFCKMFKKATGLTFTDYLARARIEKVKTLLLNPNVRISEAAYECGFASLTHFNRVFKKLTGQSPTHYRRALASLCQAPPVRHLSSRPRAFTAAR